MDEVHTLGRASMTPMGSSHALSSRAASTTSTTPMGSRTRNGSGMTWIRGSDPTLAASSEIHSAHSSGDSTTDTPTIAAVSPSPTHSARHSPRSGCHRIPIPGVTLVRNGNAQAPAPHGWRHTARTTAPARKTWMLPRRMSSTTPGKGEHPRHPHPEQDPDRQAGPQRREHRPRQKGERVQQLGEGGGVDVGLVLQPRDVVQAAGPRVPDAVGIEHRSVLGHRLGVGDEPQPDRGDVDQPRQGQAVAQRGPAGHGRLRSGCSLISMIGCWKGPPSG